MTDGESSVKSSDTFQRHGVPVSERFMRMQEMVMFSSTVSQVYECAWHISQLAGSLDDSVHRVLSGSDDMARQIVFSNVPNIQALVDIQKQVLWKLENTLRTLPESGCDEEGTISTKASGPGCSACDPNVKCKCGCGGTICRYQRWAAEKAADLQKDVASNFSQRVADEVQKGIFPSDDLVNSSEKAVSSREASTPVRMHSVKRSPGWDEFDSDNETSGSEDKQPEKALPLDLDSAQDDTEREAALWADVASNTVIEREIVEHVDLLNIKEFIRGFWNASVVGNMLTEWCKKEESPKPHGSKGLSYFFTSMVYSDFEVVGHSASSIVGSRVAAEFVRRYYYILNPGAINDVKQCRVSICKDTNLDEYDSHCLHDFYNVLCYVVGKYVCNVDGVDTDIPCLPAAMSTTLKAVSNRYAKWKCFQSNTADILEWCSISEDSAGVSSRTVALSKVRMDEDNVNSRVLKSFLIGIDVYHDLFLPASQAGKKFLVTESSNEGLVFDKETKSIKVPVSVHGIDRDGSEPKIKRSIRVKVDTAKGRNSTPKSRNKVTVPLLEHIIEQPYTSHKIEEGVAPYASSQPSGLVAMLLFDVNM